jgi:hypothetical protein
MLASASFSITSSEPTILPETTTTEPPQTSLASSATTAETQTASAASVDVGKSSGGGLSGGAIGGIVAGVLVGGVTIGIIGVFFCFRRRKQISYSPAEVESSHAEDKDHGIVEKSPPVGALVYPEEVVRPLGKAAPVVVAGNQNVGGGEEESSQGETANPSGRLRYPDNE